MDKNFDDQVQRNLMGKRLEREGNVLEAMSLYEANIDENFVGGFPYRRLAILYSKRKLLSEEVRVPQKAVLVFKSLAYSNRTYINPKLNEFQERLDKAMNKISE
tara:strand:- start:166 stop:477 length:312 start_codon:yes stop_codon:yes gene_type:complete